MRKVLIIAISLCAAQPAAANPTINCFNSLFNCLKEAQSCMALRARTVDDCERTCWTKNTWCRNSVGGVTSAGAMSAAVSGKTPPPATSAGTNVHLGNASSSMSTFSSTAPARGDTLFGPGAVGIGSNKRRGP